MDVSVEDVSVVDVSAPRLSSLAHLVWGSVCSHRTANDNAKNEPIDSQFNVQPVRMLTLLEDGT